MAWQIDEERSNVQFDVEGKRVAIIAPSGGGGSVPYIIKTDDTTQPTDENLYSALKVKNLIEGISPLSEFFVGHYENGVLTSVECLVDLWTNYAISAKGLGSGGGGGGIDVDRMWQELASSGNEQIAVGHLANALGGYQPLIDSSHKLAYSLISGTPTSLPASDVYAWAKASTKPSYTLDEVSDGATRKLAAYVLKAGDTMSGDLNTHHLIPVTTNAYNIGSASKLFQYLYARYIMSNASYALRLGIGAGDYEGAYITIRTNGKVTLGGDFSPTKAVETAAELGLGGPLFLLGTGNNKRIYFDSTHYLELDSNGYLHTNVGFYSDSFITAKGQGSGGGGGGIDVDRMWQELASSGNEQIAIGHLANALGGYQPLIDSGHKLAYSLLSGVPTKLSQFTDDVVSGHYLHVDGKAADSDKLDGYHFGYGNAHESNNNYITARFSRILDLSSLSASNFYPVTVQIGSRSAWECRIHSQSSSSSAAYNQNWIDFELNGRGWYDSPQGLIVRGYGAYDSNEICIGSIGMGADDGLGVIWLRGGLTYYCESNFVLTEHSANYSNGNEVYSVGAGFSGGTNAHVNVWFTPGVQFPVPARQFSSGMLRGGFYFQKEVKADGGFIGNLTGRATEADHADVATNADKVDGYHASDLRRASATMTVPASPSSSASYAGYYTLFTLPDMSLPDNSGVRRLTLICTRQSTGYSLPYSVDITIYSSNYNNLVIKVEGGASPNMADSFRYCGDTRQFQVHHRSGLSYSIGYQLLYNIPSEQDGARGANITPSSGNLVKDTATHTSVTDIPWTGGFYITGNIASSTAVAAKR